VGLQAAGLGMMGVDAQTGSVEARGGLVGKGGVAVAGVATIAVPLLESSRLLTGSATE